MEIRTKLPDSNHKKSPQSNHCSFAGESFFLIKLSVQGTIPWFQLQHHKATQASLKHQLF